MIMRRCPICGMTQFSADTVTDWRCNRPGCPAIITSEYNQDIPPYPANASAPKFDTPTGIRAAIKKAAILDRVTALVLGMLGDIIDKCHRGSCADRCHTCPLPSAKQKARDIVRMMEDER